MDEIDLSKEGGRVPVERTATANEGDTEAPVPEGGFVHDDEVRFAGGAGGGGEGDANGLDDGLDWLSGDEPGSSDGPAGPPVKDPDELSDGDVQRIVEAALFSAGGPVSAEAIAEATGLDFLTVREALEALVERYRQRSTAIEVTRAGEKYAMQVRQEMTDRARRFAPMEIPKYLLRTLALIAYHQPVKQSDLVDMVGSKTYDHVKQLEETGLIRAKPHGLTKMLSTSESFPEYFGIDATRPEEIREFLARKVGIEEAVSKDASGIDVVPVTGADATTAAEASGTALARAEARKAKDEEARKDEGLRDADVEEAGNVLNALLG